MKTLPRYIIFSFIIPFLMTFCIAVFVLVIHFLYLYVDDLIGKGLKTSTLVELFSYVTLSMFPLALPLAILLSSLMTFGNLGEHFELVALKSSGLSLQKIMKPLIIVAFFISAGAFIFSNNFLPYINLRMNSLIYDIQQKKPALSIKEGIFYNGIDGYTIRIAHKENDDVTCHGIMIYDHTQGMGNNKMEIADWGKIFMSEDKQFLCMILYNGTSFEEVMNEQGKYFPLVRSKFKEQTVKFDLSGFRLVRSDEELFKSSYSMLNVQQIDKAIDSLRAEKEKKTDEFKKNFSEMMTEETMLKKNSSEKIDSTHHAPVNPFGANLKEITQHAIGNNPPGAAAESKTKIIDIALNIARSKKFYAETLLTDSENYDKPIIIMNTEWHKKFTLSIACLILFFIGAPLGAIIRKGGLGMPVVVSVIIFIFFWVISITGEKMSKEGAIIPYIGMWMPVAIFLPFGIFLTRKATSDSAILDSDFYLKPFRKIFRKKA